MLNFISKYRITIFYCLFFFVAFSTAADSFTTDAVTGKIETVVSWVQIIGASIAILALAVLLIKGITDPDNLGRYIKAGLGVIIAAILLYFITSIGTQLIPADAVN